MAGAGKLFHDYKRKGANYHVKIKLVATCNSKISILNFNYDKNTNKN